MRGTASSELNRDFGFFRAGTAVNEEAFPKLLPPHCRQSRPVQSADGRLGGGFSQIIASVEAAVCARSLADNIQPACPGHPAENEDLRRLKLFFGGRLGLLQLISNKIRNTCGPGGFSLILARGRRYSVS